MTALQALARLAAKHHDDLDHPVAPLTIAGRTIDTDREPVLMGVVNLSRDSTYRATIATGVASAVRKARIQAAQGAHLVDIGAESSRSTASMVSPHDQLRYLTPVIEQLTAVGTPVSIETYHTTVAEGGLKAGACVLNLTGSHDDDAMFTLAAEHDATVVLCHILGPHARALDGSPTDTDPVPRMLDHFGTRLQRARQLGVRNLVIDPGLGFGFSLEDPHTRASYQARALLHSFRLRRLGVPICHALPHAFDIFEEQFRNGEGFFAVLAHLGGTGVYRTHEVPLIRATLAALTLIPTEL